ncbi:MAG: Mut7-C RNAse domain-containing protein [Limisphaerales bacterium]
MSRIRKAYETRFRWLLQQIGARRLDQGVQWLVREAQRLSSQENTPLSNGLTRVFEELAARPAFAKAHSGPAPTKFFCDAGLGGLARWLRAAGYEAFWIEHIDDDELLREAQKRSATLLTTDSMLMERRILRDRVLPSFWLPPTLSIHHQLELVFREFDLDLKPPRCMSCGGELVRCEKESVGARIPPKTYRWLDEYFVCAQCGKLFWHGTHWRRISQTLRELGGGSLEAAATHRGDFPIGAEQSPHPRPPSGRRL